MRILCILMGALLFALAPAYGHAQTKSAKGINVSGSSISSVAPELGDLEGRIVDTVTLMESIEGCGATGRFLADGDPSDPDDDACRTTEPISVVFDDSGPTTLTVQNPDGTLAEYNLDGAAGTATIEEATPTAVVPSTPPPATPTYDSCIAPWGATVAHDATVRAYQTASVPSGETCTRQTRRCNDGTLSGSYTHRNCTVEEEPEEPEELGCRWVKLPMTYGTSPTPRMGTVRTPQCGVVQYAPCAGCANFRATSCTPGAACDPDAGYTCLENERSCGDDATIWDRYECRCGSGPLGL